MRVIKSDTGFLFYEKIFKQLMNNQLDVVVWQVSNDGKREISHSRLNSFHMASGKLFLEALSENTLSADLPIYCYVEGGPIIFKASIEGLNDKTVSLTLPPEIRVLEEPDIQIIKGKFGSGLDDGIWKVKRLDVDSDDDTFPEIQVVKSMAQRSNRDQELLNNEFGVSLEEEDKLFAGQRSSPRARPKDDKWVKVAAVKGNGPDIYKLWDLSRGGMSYISFSENEFAKGSLIHVVGFNEFDLDDPLVGVVMSVRAVDETLSEFKVGIKFNDGQG